MTLTSQSIFEAGSPQAEHIRSLTYGFILAALAILFLVVGLTIYIVIKFRAKDDTKEPRQTTGNRTLEIGMVGVPLLLVVGFFFWSLNTMSSGMPDHEHQKPDIIITGHQWWWQAVYPGTNATAANEIHLPVGRKILMQLNSADVIHDWWVPALGGKMDMIPGVENYLWVTINKTGIYEGSCSEFCGQQHAWMRIKVVAQAEKDYNKWLIEHTRAANLPTDPLARTGQALFAKASCSNCHRISGTDAMGTEGPDLTHFGSRQTMLTGLMDNTPENINRWLTDPQKVKPGAHMPRFIFGPDSVRALTAYLKQLK
ncbi:cytochrome c oxidase subunit II [Mucilaginibacter litoreus]|uniref:Cytochrome c oxidase subunit 2 n=1 Tax=Mucilaginibacter litoreus TaxID=1048221 RepID=A0ABW3AWQ1_9SPHI